MQARDNGETLVQITPYCAARHYRRGQIAEYLWAQGSTLDAFRAAFLGERGRVEQELAASPELLHAEDPHDDIYDVPLLAFAVAGGHAGLAAALMQRGARVALYSAQLLDLAARAGRKDLVDLLLAHGADARAAGIGIFGVVSDVGLLAYLLSRGVSPHGHAEGDTPPLAYVARADKGEREHIGEAKVRLPMLESDGRVYQLLTCVRLALANGRPGQAL